MPQKRLPSPGPLWYIFNVKLSEYLKDRNLSRAEFGNIIGVSQVAITRYINGLRIPRSVHLEAIAKATDGAVKPNDFFDGLPASAPSGTDPPANVLVGGSEDLNDKT